MNYICGQPFLVLLVHYHLIPLLKQFLLRVCAEMLSTFCKEVFIKKREP